MFAVVDDDFEALPGYRLPAAYFGFYDERYLRNYVAESVDVPAGCFKKLRKPEHIAGEGA